MLLLNPFVDKWLNDRQLIMTGLILLSSAGIFPFFVQWYPLVLLSRLVFGMGIGFINAKAISIISQRYQEMCIRDRWGYHSRCLRSPYAYR